MALPAGLVVSCIVDGGDQRLEVESFGICPYIKKNVLASILFCLTQVANIEG